MTIENLQAYPLLGFRLIPNPESPTTPILALKTASGVHAVIVRKDVLLQLGEALIQAASSVPLKEDQN